MPKTVMTIAGQIDLPEDADARDNEIVRIHEALRVLATLKITHTDGASFLSYMPFPSIQLENDGMLQMVAVSESLN